MKKTKQVLSIIIMTFIMFTLCSFTVSADESFSITVTNENQAVSINGIEYTAYKVFSVQYDKANNAYTYSVDNTCLSQGQEYGDDYTIEKITNANNEATARAFGDYVYTTFIDKKTIADTVNKGTATANGETAVISVPSAGYYVIVGTAHNKDASGNVKDTESVTSLVMLNTADPNAEVKTKLDAPSLDKQIQHNETDQWGVVGDNQVGDTVNFRIITKVPDTNGYTDYTYTIHDEMTTGLGFNEGSVYVKINDETVLDPSYYTITAPAGGQTLIVDFKIKEALSAGVVTDKTYLYTYYSATLNTNALIAADAPDSTNHNDNVAYLEYSNNPYDNRSKGKTPDVKVYDWTYAFTINKVNKDDNPLAGAGFTIKKGEGETKTTITFTKKDGSEEYVVDPAGTVTEIKTTDTGTFKILGLDDQTTYTLEETTVPNGYTKCEDVTFNLTSDYENKGVTLKSLSASVNNGKENKETSDLSVKIVNLSGIKLVGTGGIGTTIFYITGGGLMIGAAVLLIIKKVIKK